MSATNRSKDRNERDFYETPAEAVRQLLRHVDIEFHVFEPACGTGAIGRALQKFKHNVSWDGVDIHEESVEACQADHLRASVYDFFTIECGRGDVVMNPPYKLAADFVRHAINQSDTTAKVCALLRLNFLGSSRKRLDLVGPKSRLAKVIVLSKRPSFTGDGKTDAYEYAWFVWEPDHTGPAQVVVSTGR